MSTIEAIEERKRQLRWQCRRGMLEIDLLFNRYLSECYSEASDAERQLFELFLTENDQQLFLWLTQKEAPSEKYASLILKLREKSSV